MAPNRGSRPRVFVDADVLFAVAVSPSDHSASLVVLQMSEITLIEALTSQQAICEAERNLHEKLPGALSAFRLLVDRCLRVVPDPRPEELVAHTGAAYEKDLPLLVAALREGCGWLVSFNVRHFQPGHPEVTVLRPRAFLMRVRDLLAHLRDTE